MVETVVVPILLALLTTLAAIYATRKQDKRLAEKQETDRAAQLNDMALELLEPYKRELAEVREIQARHEAQIKNLISERDALKEWAEKLVCQVTDAGLVPVKYVEPKTRPINNYREEVDAPPKGRKH